MGEALLSTRHMHCLSESPPALSEVGEIIPILQLQELRLSVGEQLAQGCCGLGCILKRDAEDLTCDTHECDLVWKRVFAGVIKVQVQLRSYWRRVGPSSNMTGILVREGEETQRQTHTETNAM